MRIFAAFTFLLVLSQPSFAGLDVPAIPVDTTQFATAAALANVQAGIPGTIGAFGYITAMTGGPITSMAGGRAPSTIWIPTASATDATTTETSCYSATGVGPGLTIGANVPYAGNKFRLQCNGYYSVPLVNTASLTVKVKWGATVVASFQATPVPTAANNYPFWISVTCTVRSPGAAGTVVCHGKDDFSTVLTVTSILSGPIFNTTPVTIDTTTSAKLDITATWSSVAGGQTVTATDGSVEILN